MKIQFALLLTILAINEAAASATSDWTIQTRSLDEKQISGLEQQYLIFEDQGVRLAKFGAKNDPRFELIGIDKTRRSIWLLASPYENAVAAQRPANIHRCRSISDPSERKTFYSICNSRFAVQKDGATEVDAAKLRQALESAGFMEFLAQEQLAEYRSEFAKAATAEALKRFIDRYQKNDSEGLVEQARKKLPYQELDDYRAAFNRAMNTPVPQDIGLGDPGYIRKAALRRFVNAYAVKDPEKLAVKANNELARMLEEEERQRKWHYEAVADPGTVVCLVVPTNASLYADEESWRDAGFAQIIGQTEQATPTKLKVLVNRIQAWKTFNMYQHGQLANLNVDGTNVTPGGFFWADRSAWRSCKAR